MFKKVKYFKKKSKEIAKKYLLVGFVLVILIALGFVLDKFFPIKPIQSASTDNVSGWAWGGGDDGTSAGNGWISFNCTDSRPGAPGGICASLNYGVNVNPTTGDFSGYAWAGGGVDAAGNLVPTLGWISFNRTVTGNPPAAPYNSGSGPIANFDFVSKRVRGWAKALAADGNGWDGWIKFGDIGGTGDWSFGGKQVYVQTQAGPDEFRGWAWGDMVVGWISFNCADRGVCGTSNYKVLLDMNFPPTVTNLNITDPDWCGSPPFYTFSWTFTDPGDTESRFDFQILEAGNPVVDREFSGLSYPDGTQNNQTAIVAISPNPDIYYGKLYSWQVKVYDSNGVDSGWVPGGSFTTKAHHYPSPDFSLSPQRPSAGENVQFTDLSTCYDDNINGSDCTKPNDSYLWVWTRTSGSGTVNYDNPLTPFLENPPVSFSSPGTWDVTLEVTDSTPGGTFKCSSVPKSVNVSLPLPEWKEIIPR